MTALHTQYQCICLLLVPEPPVRASVDTRTTTTVTIKVENSSANGLTSGQIVFSILQKPHKPSIGYGFAALNVPRKITFNATANSAYTITGLAAGMTIMLYQLYQVM